MRIKYKIRQQVTYMFSFFKRDPVRKLNKLHDEKLEQAMFAQRNGNIKAYAMITEEAENIALQIKALESQNEHKSSTS